MCKKLKPHMVYEPKFRGSSQRKPVLSSSEEIHINPPSRSTEISGGSSLFSKASSSSGQSLASFRDSLPENPIIYRYKELANATAQFTSGRLGNSSVWKCVLRGKTVAVTVRNKKREIREFRSGLREICNAHHASVVKLLGGCYDGENGYLVYEYVQGSSLEDCLRVSKAPGFTVLGSWLSRMQIAVDVAQGLEYMHHDTNIKYVHNYIKSSSILVTEPGYRARICHLGASYLAGEYDTEGVGVLPQRSSMKITGTQGYMAPEYINSGIVSQKADVFALGVVLLELLSGHEPIRYVADEGGRGIRRIGLIQSLNIVISEAGDNFAGRLRRWMDPRLRDSFPVDCAERVARLAASCVDPDPGKRPNTRYVAGELSRVFIMSEQWSERMNANKTYVSGTFEAR